MSKRVSQISLMFELERFRLEEEDEDRAIVEPKRVKKEESETAKTAKAAPRLDPKILEVFPYPFYLDAITRKIARNWDVSEWALAKLNRHATLRFKITLSGALESLRLHESSGDEGFDSACLRAVSLSDPLPPLPAEYSKNELAIIFDFELSY